MHLATYRYFPLAAALIGALYATTLSACSLAPERPRVEHPRDVSDPPAEGDPTGGMRTRVVYVPAYSHLHGGPDQKQRMLSILLSVRNMDSVANVTLTHVDYFDTSGHRVRRYLAEPTSLRPLQTMEFIVENQDDVGGSGANFLVYWEGPSDAHPLLTETIMWGHVGGGYISFTSRGVELDRRPDPGAFMVEDDGTPPPAKAPPPTAPPADAPRP